MFASQYALQVLSILSRQHGALNSRQLAALTGERLKTAILKEMADDGYLEVVPEGLISSYTITSKGRRLLRMNNGDGSRALGRESPPSEVYRAPVTSVRAGSDVHCKLPSLGNWPKDR